MKLALALLYACLRMSAQERPDFEEGQVARAGFALHYRATGSGDSVLILSGGPGFDSGYMLPVARAISPHARAILLEQRGTGRSLPPVIDRETISLANALDDLEALRAQLKLDRWTVLGHSAGGLLSLYYAAAHPGRIGKLILVGSAPMSSESLQSMTDNMNMRLSPADRSHLEALQKSAAPSPAEMFKILVPTYFYDPAIASQLGALNYHAQAGGLLAAEMIPKAFDIRPRLKSFDRPVLILNGRQDPVDPGTAYENHLALKSSTLKFVNRAGHFPWIEQPTAVYKLIDDFLNEVK